MNEDEPVYGEACYKISLKNYPFLFLLALRMLARDRDGERKSKKNGELR